MAWVLLLAIVVVGIIVTYVLWTRNDLVAILVGIVFGVIALFVGCRNMVLALDKSTCSQWSQETNRETKFAQYTIVTWQCLTPDENGTWIPNDQIRDFGGEG